MTFVLWLLTGSIVGVLHGVTLWWTVARLQPDAPRHAVVWALGGTMLRWGITASLLITALQRGIMLGLLAFAGLFLVRWSMTCWLALGQRSSGLFDA
jgi:hypothetical protein